MRAVDEMRPDKFGFKNQQLDLLQQGSVEWMWNQWQKEKKFSAMLKHAYNRRFARTSKGCFCLVPAATKKGDLVGVFCGASVPLVLSEYGEEWQLVGESYVHGIMHGEAYDENPCKTIRFR